MVDIQPRLASFTTRPPTPPKERIQDPAKLLHDSDNFFYTAYDQFLDTPDDSPSSSAENCCGSFESHSKRVRFSPWTKYHKPYGNGSKSISLENQIRPLPPSRDNKFSKSILKPSVESFSVAPMGELPTLDLNNSISVMLQSVTQHLESTSRNSRIDAYTALLGCLCAYDNIPDVQKLVDRLPELTRFFRRDILATNEETGSLDTHLVAQVLKLLTFFLATPGIAECLSDDFCSYIIDQSIASLEDQSVPKIVTTHYMLLLAKQSFASKHTSTERINRLITVLDRVATMIKGNRVVAQRLMIYRRLLTQAKQVMITRVGDWIGHLITGILSKFRDIRSWAICFGLEASLSLGTTKLVSQTCVEMFNRESPEGKKVVDCLASRLTQMATAKDDGDHVPQIWIIVLLFLRSRRHQLESWEHLKSWLLIIQKCFNSSDLQTKFQANIAWNRFIFAINLDSSTSSAMITMLRQPIASQLDRKSIQKVSKKAKHVARSSYCTLLYYAFRPSATYAQLDQYWEEYIAQMSSCDKSTSSPDIDYTCDILAALFSCSQPKAWDENRANVNELIKPADLPCLDPKWVRSRSATILKVFETIFCVADWNARIDQEAPVILAWRSLMAALGEAGSKEVKVSMETMTAMAHLVNTIQLFWHQGRKQAEAEAYGVSDLVARFELLVQEAVAKIGIIPFTEKRLTQSSQESFEAAETPSTRSIRSQGPLSSPVSSLLDLLVSSVEDSQISDNFRCAVESLMHLALRSATSRRTQLAVLRDFVNLIMPDGQSISQSRVLLWNLIVKAAGLAFDSPKACEKHGESPQMAGYEYRDAVKILEIAVRHNFTDAVIEWQDFGTIVAHHLKQEIGDEAVALTLIEPLAAALNQSFAPRCWDFYLTSSTFLLNSTRWPQSRHALERARKMLWGVSFMSQRHALDPFDHIYSMINEVSKTAYSRLPSTRPQTVIDFMLAIVSFISSCPLSLRITPIKHIQRGLAIWIEDAQGLLMISAENSRNLYNIVMNMWGVIAGAIEASTKIDDNLLLILETLIISSLRSRQKAVVKESIMMWDRTFGTAEYLQYSDALRPILRKLRMLTEISLPSFPDGIDEVTESSPLDFVETQISSEQYNLTPSEPSPRVARTPRLINKMEVRLENPSWPPRVVLEEPLQQSPKVQTPKTTPKRRLRHEDSQIQFAAIESSPLALEAADSQLLTDRQKEVRERQALDGGIMFPDLRSTPKSKTRERGEVSPKLILRQSTLKNLTTVETHSALPSTNNPLEDVFGSSPTLRACRKSLNSLISSPLGRKRIERDFDTNHRTSSPSGLAQDATAFAKEMLMDNINLKSEFRSDVDAEPTTTSKNSLEPFRMEIDVSQDYLSEPGKQFVLADTLAQNILDIHSPSNPDLFVDAHSVPLPTIEASIQRRSASFETPVELREIIAPPDGHISKEIIHESSISCARGNEVGMDWSNENAPKVDDVSRVMGSSQESEASHPPSEEDQIAAQLVNDLQRASSQAKARIVGYSSSDEPQEKMSNKRKGSFEILEQPVKKAKVVPQPQRFQIVVESRASTKAGYEYVSANEHSLYESPSTAKQEHPSIPASLTKATGRELANKKKRGRPSKSSSNHKRGLASEEVGLLKVREEHSYEPRTGNATTPAVPSRRRSARLHSVSMESWEPQSSLLPDYQATNTKGRIADTSGNDAKAARPRSHLKRTEIKPTSDPLDQTGISSTPSKPAGGVQKVSADSARIDREDNMSSLQPDKVHGEMAEDCQVQAEVENTAAQPLGNDLSSTHSVVAANPVGLQGLLLPRQQPEKTQLVEPKPRAQGILAGFKRLLGDIRGVRLEAEEEREIVGVLFETVREVYEAGRRST